MSRNSLLETCVISEILSDCNGTQSHNHLVHKQTLNYLAKFLFIYEIKRVNEKIKVRTLDLSHYLDGSSFQIKKLFITSGKKILEANFCENLFV